MGKGGRLSFLNFHKNRGSYFSNNQGGIGKIGGFLKRQSITSFHTD